MKWKDPDAPRIRTAILEVSLAALSRLDLRTSGLFSRAGIPLDIFEMDRWAMLARARCGPPYWRPGACDATKGIDVIPGISS